MIKVSINKTCARLQNAEPLTAGMIGKQIELSFSEDWQDLNKIAVFSNGDTTKDVLESQWSGNVVTIPHEVLATVGKAVSIGVYGYSIVDGEKVLAIPSVVEVIGTVKSGADPSGDPEADPTLPIWAQLQWEIDHFEVDPEIIAEQVQQYLEQHPVEIQPATASVLGGIKVGEGLSVTADGTLSAASIDAYTKAETDALLDGKQPSGDYATTQELGALAGIVAGKADISDIPSLDGYATEQWVENKGYLTQHQSLAGYATESYVQNYHDSTKQDVINDLDDIRSGAELGATALQSVPNTYRTASAQDVIDNGKQDKLIAGANITIAADGKTISATGGGIPDAPSDGKQYARKDGAWAEVQSGGGGETVNLWQGKIASFMGDSITEGVNTNKTYAQYLKELFALSTIHNYGIGGSTISGTGGMCDRIVNVAADSDVIFIFGGTNDFGGSVPMGEFWAVDEDGERTIAEDTSTFKGSLVKMCNWLTTNRSNANVIFLTPIHRAHYGYSYFHDLNKNLVNLYLEDYVQAVKDACALYSFECIDLWSRSGLNPQNAHNQSVYFGGTDGLHPNAFGHELIANTIKSELQTIVPRASHNVPCTGITLDRNTASVAEGETITLVATPAPNNTTDPVVWSTSDSTKATVANGVVTGVAEGNATITATCGSYHADCVVTVTAGGGGGIVLTEGKAISASGAVIDQAGSYAYTDFYPVTTGNKYTVAQGSGSQSICVYGDTEEDYYSVAAQNTGGAYTFEAPTGTTSMRFSADSDTATVTEVAAVVSTSTEMTSGITVMQQANKYKGYAKASTDPKEYFLENFYPVEDGASYHVENTVGWLTIAGYDSSFNYVKWIVYDGSKAHNITIDSGIAYIRVYIPNCATPPDLTITSA